MNSSTPTPKQLKRQFTGATATKIQPIHRFAVCSALCLVAAIPTAQAATYYVATTGSDSNNPGTISQPFLTVQMGATTAQPGDTVFVRGGTYVETVTLSTSGTATNKIVLSGYPGETAIIDGQNTLPTGPASTAKWGALIHVTGDYVEVHDLTLRNSRGRGLFIDQPGAPGHCVAKNLKISYCWTEGINTYKTEHTLIENCEVWQCTTSNAPPNRGVENWTGSLVSINCDYTTITGCSVHECHGEGICDLRSDNTIIQDCTAWDNYKVNIYLDNSQYSTVRRNVVYATNNTVFWRFETRPTPAIIVANEDYTGVSRFPNFALDILICNNFIYNTGTAMAFWHQVSGSTAQNVTIANNTFVNELTGTAGSTSLGYQIIGDYTTMTGNVFTNNIVSIDLGTLATGTNAGVTFSYNNWSQTPPTGFGNANDVTGDPLLTLGSGTPNSDWLKLTSSSPGINEGQVVSLVTEDYFGAARGGNPDIGAHEFAGGSIPASPSGLTATPVLPTQVNLSWTDNANNETGFRIERRTGAGAYGLLTTPATNAATHNDSSSVAAGTTYTYRIRAENANGNSAWSNEASATTPTTVTLTATADAYVQESAASTNYGTNALIMIRDGVAYAANGGWRETFVKFDISSIPVGATITSAKLRLNCNSIYQSHTDSAVKVYQITASWTEGTATWNNRPAHAASAEATVAVTSTGWKEWTITSLVAAWRAGTQANNGVKVRAEAGGWLDFSSRESANDPELVITYTP